MIIKLRCIFNDSVSPTLIFSWSFVPRMCPIFNFHPFHIQSASEILSTNYMMVPDCVRRFIDMSVSENGKEIAYFYFNNFDDNLVRILSYGIIVQ